MDNAQNEPSPEPADESESFEATKPPSPSTTISGRVDLRRGNGLIGLLYWKVDMVEEIISTEESESYSVDVSESERESELEEPQCDDDVCVASSSCISVSESSAEELDAPFRASNTPSPRSYREVSAATGRSVPAKYHSYIWAFCLHIFDINTLGIILRFSCKFCCRSRKSWKKRLNSR
jgi:hypothetical protein